MQRELFEKASPNQNTFGLTTGFRDSAFTKNKELPVHRWVPWIAGFSANFVDDCLSQYLGATKGRDSIWILDPFAGVGTTLFEAYRQGFNVIGFEINPYAALAGRLKLESTKIRTQELADQISAFEKFMDCKCPDGSTIRSEPNGRPPQGFNGRSQLFSECVEKRILFVLDFVNSIEDRRIRDLFRLALGSVMISVSNYSYEPSLTRRATVEKPCIEDAPVRHALSAKLHLMLADIELLRQHMREMGHTPEAKVFARSIFSAEEILDKGNFIDLVITSPPYLNNYHYPRNTRPQLHWLGFSNKSGYSAAGENESFGKFWQTVRSLPPINLSFKLSALENVIDTVRHLNPQKGPYGGAGWANYIATYFNDTYRFCRLLKELLRRNGVAVVVIGNSIIQGVEVKTDLFFGKIAEACGLVFENSLVVRRKRTGTSIIQSSVRVEKAKAKSVLYESAIVLRK